MNRPWNTAAKALPSRVHLHDCPGGGAVPVAYDIGIQELPPGAQLGVKVLRPYEVPELHGAVLDGLVRLWQEFGMR